MSQFLGTSIQYSERQIKRLEKEHEIKMEKIAQDLINKGYMETDLSESEFDHQFDSPEPTNDIECESWNVSQRIIYDGTLLVAILAITGMLYGLINLYLDIENSAPGEFTGLLDYDFPPSEQSILVHTKYFDPKQKYIINEENEKIEKFIDPLDMRPIKVYGMSIEITVFSSVAQKINILKQLPLGSIALINGYSTKIDVITMNPYTVKKFQIPFYLPSIGTFQQYPVTIYKPDSGIIVSSLQWQQFDHKIICKQQDGSKSKLINIELWTQVFLDGNYQEIYQYSSKNNLYNFDLSRMYNELKQSKPLFEDVLKLCYDQNHFDDAICPVHFYPMEDTFDGRNKFAPSICHFNNKLNGEISQLVDYYIQDIVAARSGVRRKRCSLNGN